MSTQVTEKGEFVEIATVSGPGKRKRLARTPVLVRKGDKEGIRLEIIRQAVLVRVEAGVKQPSPETVV